MERSDKLSGRDGAETLVELRETVKVGIEIWFHAKEERFTYGDFKSNISYFTEAKIQRRISSDDPREDDRGVPAQAHRGYVLDGRRFGYTNITVPCSRRCNPKKSQRPSRSCLRIA